VSGDTEQAKADQWLADLKEALASDAALRFETVNTFGVHSGDHVGIRVSTRPAWSSAKWVPVGPVLFPPDGETAADTLTMLAGMMREVSA
jgi:hypothetical protein